MPGPAMGGGPRSRRAYGPKPDIGQTKGVLKRLIKYVMNLYLVPYIIVLICVLVTVFASIKGTLFMQTLIDDYITPMVETVKNGGQADYGPLGKAVVKIAVIYGCGVLASFIQARLMIYISQGTMLKLRRDLFSHMEKLPISYFDTHSHGDIMSIYTNDVDTLRQLISQSIPQIISSVITIIGVFISMLRLSLPLTGVTILMILIVSFTTKKYTSKAGNYFVAQQQNLGAMNGFIEERMNGQKVVKVFNHEDICKSEFKELNDKLYDSAYNANRYANSLGPINTQLGNLSFVLCTVVGGLLSLGGMTGLTLGKLASFLTFNKSINTPISQISMQINSIVMGIAGADRVFKLMDAQPEADDGYVTLVPVTRAGGELIESNQRTGIWAWKHYHKDTKTTTFVEVKGDIVMDDVDFGYTDEKMVLHDIKLYAEPGQKIAFVGSTGAGKTTITNLINRFYDIQDGKIRYDGINVNKIKKADLRHSLGMVLQDTHLFSGTVKDNIRYGKLDATDEEIYAAARLANADKFIEGLPEGYDTKIVGDGTNLSQGQRQLLAIARAAVADPPVLILDEATSSIDTRTEKIVQDGMDKLMGGRTTFVIAHRLSTVKNADCIMVLEQGRIIERGTHDELISAKGKYYQLYTGNKPEKAS